MKKYQIMELRAQIEKAREYVREIRGMDLRKQCADQSEGILPVSFKLQDLAGTLSVIAACASADAQEGIDYPHPDAVGDDDYADQEDDE